MRRLGPVLEFMRALWALDHALQSASKRMEASFGVTAPQRIVIRIVGRFPKISAGELAEILHLHPSTLTARGRKVDALRTGTTESAVRRVLADLPPGTAQSARALADRLAAELDELGG